MTIDKHNMSALQRQLERAVHQGERGAYDVEAGLLRHRELVTSGAPLPDWAEGVGSQASMAARSLWRGRALTGLGVLVIGAASVVGVQRIESGSRPVAVAPRAPQVSEPSTTPAPQDGERLQTPREHAAPAQELGADGPAPQAKPRVAMKARERGEQPIARELDLDQLARQSVESALNAPSAPARAVRGSHGPVVVGSLPRAGSAEEAGQHTAAGGARSPQAKSDKSTFQRVQGTAAERPAVVVEMEELSRAEASLAKDPARALAEVRKSSAKYPGGYLQEERRYVEIMATLGLRRVEEARLLGKDFVRLYPQSPYRRRVERAITDAIRAQ